MTHSSATLSANSQSLRAVIRLLIVEDDEYYARVLRRSLSKREDGFVVTWVDKLSVALRVLENESFDIILTDLNLSDATGLASFQALHAMRSDIPVVILSSDGDVQLALQAVAQGAQDFLIKERVSYDSIARCIRYTIQRRNFEESRLRLEAINDFVAMLAHDLNIPLLAADRALELLLSSQMDESQRLSLLRKLKTANEEQLNKVKRMLEAYRYETASTGIQMETVNIIEVFKNCLVQVATRYPDRNWTSNMRPLADSCSSLRANRESLELVFINILDNAVRFGPDGQNILIELQELHGSLVIRISDEGPGITEDVRARLFRHAWHGTPGKTYTTSGQYGLYLCHKIVRMHNGTIDCTDAPNKGTVLTITLPTM